MSAYIDLSHTVSDGMLTFKGLRGPVIRGCLSREASRRNYTGGTEFQIGRIDMLPARVRGMGTFPVRACAALERPSAKATP